MPISSFPLSSFFRSTVQNYSVAVTSRPICSPSARSTIFLSLPVIPRNYIMIPSVFRMVVGKCQTGRPQSSQSRDERRNETISPRHRTTRGLIRTDSCEWLADVGHIETTSLVVCLQESPRCHRANVRRLEVRSQVRVRQKQRKRYYHTS